MVKDTLTNDAYRVDHLIESELEKQLKDRKTDETRKNTINQVLKNVKNSKYKPDEIDELIKEFNIKSPLTGNQLSKVEAFNLMFATSVGPYGTFKRCFFNLISSLGCF